MVSDSQTITPFPDPAIAELRKRIEKAGTQKVAAGELDISESLLTEILKGRRSISPTLLEKLGFSTITVRVPSGLVVPVAEAIEQAISEARHLNDLRTKVGKK